MAVHHAWAELAQMNHVSLTSNLLASLPILFFISSAQAEPQHYIGICDASAAIALDSERFVVADDEYNILRIYRRGEPKWESATIDLNPLLGTEADDESDIEAMARIGNRIYLITSHAHNSEGKPRNKRLRFFAADLTVVDGHRTLVPAAMAYRTLRDDLVSDAGLERFDLADTVRSGQKPEDPGGFSIEGLAATPDGGLLIGFRNPLVSENDRNPDAEENGRALLVPIHNPAEVVAGHIPAIGEPATLALGERGTRSIEWIDDHYAIVAGPIGGEGSFAVFNWTPGAGNENVEQIDIEFPEEFRPEALFVWPDGAMTFLSDDGDREIGSQRCKDLTDIEQRSFRAWSP